MTDTGRIHLYYGDGKGKTTAAMGLIMRAAGYGRKILVYQFLKDNSSGERAVLEALPAVTCLPGRDRVKFFSQMKTGSHSNRPRSLRPNYPGRGLRN